MQDKHFKNIFKNFENNISGAFDLYLPSTDPNNIFQNDSFIFFQYTNFSKEKKKLLTNENN